MFVALENNDKLKYLFLRFIDHPKPLYASHITTWE